MSAAVLSHEEWIAKRRNILTASRVAAVLGAHPSRGGLGVYEEMTTGHSLEDNAWLKYGRDIEAAIANMYSDKTGRQVYDLGATTITMHPDLPWLGATLDRTTSNDQNEAADFPLELKSIDPYGAKIRPEEFADEPPLHMQIQLMVQMACTGASWGSLAALFPGYNLRWVDFDRDDNFLNAAYPKLEEFWDRVQRKDPPPPDSYRDLEIVKRLWSQADGETVELPQEMIPLVDDWQRAKDAAREAGKDGKECEASIRALIGDATFGRLPDGRILSLKVTERKAYTRVVEAGTYRTLRMMKVKGK